MTSTTVNYGLHIFDLDADKLEAFQYFRDLIAGVGTNSNMYKIDGKLKEWKDLIDAVADRQGVIRAVASWNGSKYTTILASVTDLDVGLTIAVIPDTTNVGTSLLQINSLADTALVKINSTGTVINLVAGDLIENHAYIFMYDGSNFVWTGATSADQIHVVGYADEFLGVSAMGTIESTGVTLDTDVLLVANSDVRVPSQKAVKSYAVTNGAVSTSEALAVFASTTGKAIKDGAVPGTIGNLIQSDGSKWVSISSLSKLMLTGASNLNITSDTITVTQSVHKLTPQTSTSDSLSTISGMANGQFLILFLTSPSTDTITIKHGVGNISCFGGDDITLTTGMVTGISDGTRVYISGGGSIALTSKIDQAGGTGASYGAITGLINGSNTSYTVSAGSYASGTMTVYLNGQLQTLGSVSSNDWSETTPASGTFAFTTAPETGDIILAMYQY